MLRYELKLRWQPDRRELTGTATFTSGRRGGHRDGAGLLHGVHSGQRDRRRRRPSTPTWNGARPRTPATLAADAVATLGCATTARRATVPMPSEPRRLRRRARPARRRGRWRGVDDAGALRRLHLVSGQRPALRRGALRRRRSPSRRAGPAVANGAAGRDQTGRPGTPTGGGRRPGRDATWRRWRSAGTRRSPTPARAVCRSPTGCARGKDEAFEPALRTYARAARLAGGAVRPVPVPDRAAWSWSTRSRPWRRSRWSPTGAAAHGPDARPTATVEEMLLHEYAHQWFGDAVTPDRLARHVAQRGLRHVRGVAVERSTRGRIRTPSWVSPGPARRRAVSRPVAGPPGNPQAGPLRRSTTSTGPGADAARDPPGGR